MNTNTEVTYSIKPEVLKEAKLIAIKIANKESSLKKLRGFFAYNEVDNKEAERFITNNAIGKGKSKNFITGYYDLLISGTTVREAEDFILGEGAFPETSQNTINHKSHYLRLFKLVEDVKKEVEIQRLANLKAIEDKAKVDRAIAREIKIKANRK